MHTIFMHEECLVPEERKAEVSPLGEVLWMKYRQN